MGLSRQNGEDHSDYVPKTISYPNEGNEHRVPKNAPFALFLRSSINVQVPGVAKVLLHFLLLLIYVPLWL